MIDKQTFNNANELDVYIKTSNNEISLQDKMRVFQNNHGLMKSNFFKDNTKDVLFNISFINTSAFSISPYDLIENLTIKKLEDIYNLSNISFYKILKCITPWMMNDTKFIHLKDLFDLMKDDMFPFVLDCFNGNDISYSISYRYYDLRNETVNSILKIFTKLNNIFPNCDFNEQKTSALVNHNYLGDHYLENVVEIIINDHKYEKLGFILIEHNLKLKTYPNLILKLIKNKNFAKKIIAPESPCSNFLSYEHIDYICNEFVMNNPDYLIKLSNALSLILNHSNKSVECFDNLFQIIQKNNILESIKKHNIEDISRVSKNNLSLGHNELLASLIPKSDKGFLDFDEIGYVIRLAESCPNLLKKHLELLWSQYYHVITQKELVTGQIQAEINFYSFFVRNENCPSLILHKIDQNIILHNLPTFLLKHIKEHKNYSQVADNILEKIKKQ